MIIKRKQMDLKFKRIIAREFLAFILVVVLSLIVFAYTFLQNEYWHSKCSSIELQIHEKKDSISKLTRTYEMKYRYQRWLFNEMSSYYDLEDLNSVGTFWDYNVSLVAKNSLIPQWDVWRKDKAAMVFFNRLGFYCGDSLQSFINANTMTDYDLMNKKRSEQIADEIHLLNDKKIEAKNKVFTTDLQISIAINWFLVFAFIIFVLRYLFYGVRWSISILSQKTNID